MFREVEAAGFRLVEEGQFLRNPADPREEIVFRVAFKPTATVLRSQRTVDIHGAATDLMDQAWWSPGITHPDGTSTFSLWFTAGIFVDEQSAMKHPVVASCVNAIAGDVDRKSVV